MNFNLSDEERNALIKHFKKCMKKPTPLMPIPDTEYIKLPNSIYIIVNELGEIDNVFYGEDRAEKYCEMMNETSVANTFYVEKHGIHDAEEE